MTLYKLKSRRQYGDMPGDYEFQVASPTIPLQAQKTLKRKLKD